MKRRHRKLAGALVIAFGVNFFGLAFMYRTFVTQRQLGTYFARLQPGMSYSEVTRFMPAAMLNDKRSCTSVVSGTVLVHSNAVPAFEVYCSGHAFPLGGIEAGLIYFDAEEKLVGARYSSSGGGARATWAPHWGVLKQ